MKRTSSTQNPAAREIVIDHVRIVSYNMNVRARRANCRKDVTEILNQLVEEFGVSAYEINNGLCEDFAMTAIDRLEGSSDHVYECVTESFTDADGCLPDGTQLGGHVWIHYYGRYYDAECPEGVADWKELPIFRRYLHLARAGVWVEDLRALDGAGSRAAA